MQGNNEVQVNLMDYLLGGRSDFTLVQDGTAQVDYTIQANDKKTCYFVYTESLTTGKVIYQGYFTPSEKRVCRAKKVNVDEYNERAIRALEWVFRHSERLPSVVHIYHHGRCSRCGKKLTDAESLACGLGPSCRKKVFG